MSATAVPSIRILIVDDHPLVREGLAAIIRRRGGMEVVGEAASGPDAVEQYRRHRPDVMLMDLGLPGMDGVEVIRAVRRDHPDARILVLTVAHGDEDIFQALQAGARGYLFKDAPREEVLDAIAAVRAGLKRVCPEAAQSLAERAAGPGLTSREREVLHEMISGKSNKEVGETLGIAESTVKAHVNSILGKLGAADRTQAVTTALQRGIVRFER